MENLTPQEVFDLIAQDFGSHIRLTEGDYALCAERTKKFKELPQEERLCAHLCFLRYEGQCGAHKTGRIAYLLNPDHEATFEVTLRVHVCINDQKTTREVLLRVPPVTKLGLSCTKTFTRPEATLCFTILEEKIV